MEHAVSVATRVAGSNVRVLITGESGAGKDVFAHLIHSRSARSSERFVAQNCAGLAETLLESELFGHVKGSFTGAYRHKIGCFEQAHQGTVFLDEIGDMGLCSRGGCLGADRTACSWQTASLKFSRRVPIVPGTRGPAPAADRQAGSCLNNLSSDEHTYTRL